MKRIAINKNSNKQYGKGGWQTEEQERLSMDKGGTMDKRRKVTMESSTSPHTEPNRWVQEGLDEDGGKGYAEEDEGPKEMMYWKGGKEYKQDTVKGGNKWQAKD